MAPLHHFRRAYTLHLVPCVREINQFGEVVLASRGRFAECTIRPTSWPNEFSSRREEEKIAQGKRSAPLGSVPLRIRSGKNAPSRRAGTKLFSRTRNLFMPLPGSLKAVTYFDIRPGV
jgi:hypothetical protein